MDWSTLVPTAFGALIGGIGPVLVVLLQNRHARSLELKRLAVEAAVEEWKAQAAARADVGPLTSYMYHHARVVEMLASGRVAEADWAKLAQENARLKNLFEHLTFEHAD
jgi:ABC-type enterobactin transport system permease subunit